MPAIARYVPAVQLVEQATNQYEVALPSSLLAPWEHAALAVPETAAQAREHPVSVYLARLSPGCRDAQHGLLDRAARILSGGLHRGAMTFPWHLLRYQDMAAFRATLSANYKYNTANNYLSTVRAVLKECRRLGMMSADDYYRTVDVPRVTGSDDAPAGRHVTAEELDAVFDLLDQDLDPIGRRDAAMFAILRSTGVRREELVNLDLADYDPVQACLTIRHGKGNKRRLVFLPAWAQEYVEEWLQVRGRRPGPLVCVTDRWGGTEFDNRLAKVSVGWIVTRRIEQAGVRHFTPHDLRRSFAGDLLEEGHDIVKVQKAMGHASPATTAAYDRRPLASRRNMAESIRPPLPGRRCAVVACAPSSSPLRPIERPWGASRGRLLVWGGTHTWSWHRARREAHGRSERPARWPEREAPDHRTRKDTRA